MSFKSMFTMLLLGMFLSVSLIVSEAYCAGMPENVKARNVDEPQSEPPSPPEGFNPPPGAFEHEGFNPPPGASGPDGFGPPPHIMQAMKPGRAKNKDRGGMDFLKNLTPEQREETKRYMTLGKSYNDLADVYVDAGKSEEAIAVLKKFASLKLPSYIPAEHIDNKKKMVNIRIVQIYLKCGKDAEAIAEAESLIKKGDMGVEEQAHLYSMMGNLYKKKGEKEKAADMLKKTIDLLEKNLDKK